VKASTSDISSDSSELKSSQAEPEHYIGPSVRKASFEERHPDHSSEDGAGNDKIKRGILRFERRRLEGLRRLLFELTEEGASFSYISVYFVLSIFVLLCVPEIRLQSRSSLDIDTAIRDSCTEQSSRLHSDHAELYIPNVLLILPLFLFCELPPREKMEDPVERRLLLRKHVADEFKLSLQLEIERDLDQKLCIEIELNSATYYHPPFFSKVRGEA